MQQLRSKYTYRDERLMWSFLYQQLKAGSTIAFAPKGILLWKAYADIEPTGKTASSLTSHFRKQMYGQIHDARLPVDQVLFIAYALQLPISGYSRRLLEHRHKVWIRLTSKNTVSSYILNGEKYVFDGEEANIVVCKSKVNISCKSCVTDDESNKAAVSNDNTDMGCSPSGSPPKTIPLEANKERVEESTTPASGSGMMVLSPDAQRLTCNSAVNTILQSAENDKSFNQKTSLMLSNEVPNVADGYETDRQIFLAALTKQPGYVGIQEIIANAELEYALERARAEGIPLMDLIAQFVSDKRHSCRVFDLK